MTARDRRRGLGPVAVSAVLIVSLLLAAFASVIAISQHQTKSRSTTNFYGRVQTTAAFASDYMSALSKREITVATEYLSSQTVSLADYNLINQSFGFSAAVLLDSKGRALAVEPTDAKLIGVELATKYAHLTAAEKGKIAVSNVVSSAAKGLPVVAVAVPFETPFGRRVYSGAFPVAKTPLGQYFNHVVVSKKHEVYLTDASGKVIASNPATTDTSLSAVSPDLARAIAHAKTGTYNGKFGPSTFAVSVIAGTPWRLVLGEPDAVLYSSTRGFAGAAPWFVFGATAILAFLLVLAFLRSVIDRRALANLSKEMEEAAETDELTGLANRRRLVAQLELISKGARAGDRNAALLMIDLDKFKSINDTYGHDIGDRTLIAVGHAMRITFRESDVFGRWGGDEFLAILPETTPAEATSIAERLRAELLQTTVSTGTTAITIPVSIGVATGASDADDLLRRADVALYGAKEQGGAVIEENMARSNL